MHANHCGSLLELFLSEWFRKTPLKRYGFMSNQEFYSFIYLICKDILLRSCVLYVVCLMACKKIYICLPSNSLFSLPCSKMCFNKWYSFFDFINLTIKINNLEIIKTEEIQKKKSKNYLSHLAYIEFSLKIILIAMQWFLFFSLTLCLVYSHL